MGNRAELGHPVRCPESRAFRRNGKYREDWWAYTINSEGIPALLGTYDFSQGVSISEQTSELRELPTVQLMMFRKYLDDRRFGVDRHPSVITIYRPPHGKTFEEFLKELQEK